MKACTRCKELKPLSEFHNCASKKDGKFSACKDCRNSYSRNKNKKIGYGVLYQRYIDRIGADAASESSRARYKKNKEAIKARSKQWSAANPEKKKAAGQRHYQQNKQRYLDNASDWANKNRERRREIARNSARKMNRSKCPEHIAIVTARKMVHRVLSSTGKKKTGRTYELLGYSKQDLVRHLESLFVEGMGWHNHGDWHVDHIIPVSELARCGVTDPAKINALANLQPLWARDNLSKRDSFALAPLEAAHITKGRSCRQKK